MCSTQNNKTNTSGKDLKETDMSNVCYSIKEFKVMVIKVLCEHRRRMNEYSEYFNKQRKYQTNHN